MLKKLIATALAAAMIFGLVSVGFAATSPFPDTAGVEQEAAIAKLKTLGLVKGDEKGNFRPYSTINRAEFTAMVVRMLNLEAAANYVNNPTVFPDVGEQWSWAYGYINIATGRGLIKGFEDGTFRPGEPVTQAQALTILLRALGYNDNLPGDWPVDYIMKGAELGIIGGGFAGGIGATRALVAEMVVKTLDQAPVKEDPDAPGNFDEKTYSLYEDVFGLARNKQTAYVKGEVTGYSTSKATLSIDGTAYDYAGGLVIYGKDSLAELKGQFVSALKNKDGKIIFVEVTTPGEVVGKITAVDAVNKTVTVGGIKYSLVDQPEIYKNGSLLTGNLAGQLADIKDADAKLLKNEDGLIYRIEASILDLEGIIQAKSTAWLDGEVVYRIKVNLADGTLRDFTVADDCTIVRNGAAAGIADLKVGDSIKFALDEDDAAIVYIDAFSQTLEGYTLVAIKWTDDGRQLTFEKDGKEYVYLVNEDNYDDSQVKLNELALDTEYTFKLDRDGKIVYMEEYQAEEVTTGGDVKKIVSKYTSGTSSNRQYKIDLADGTTLVLSDFKGNAYLNGVLKPISSEEDAIALWNAVAVGSLVKGSEDGKELRFYAESVTGKVYGSGSRYVVVPDSGDPVEFDMGVTAITLNGKRISKEFADVRIPDASPDSNFRGTVKFDGTDGAAGLPMASEVSFDDFKGNESQSGYRNLPVKEVIAGSSDYIFVLRALDENKEAKVPKNGLVIKDGNVASRTDVVVGDKMSWSPELTIPVGDISVKIPAYAKVSTDTTAPSLYWDYDGDGKSDQLLAATWKSDVKELTITFRPSEPCGYVYVWVDGVQYEFDDSAVKYVASYNFGGTVGSIPAWQLTIDYADTATKPSKVSVQVVDFAGNMSSVRSVNVQ